jgi:cyanophycinase
LHKGYLLLEGGDEFSGRMSDPDRRAIKLAGGMHTIIAIIPAAAAPDHNHLNAGNNGVRWFKNLGVKRVSSLAIIDPISANLPENVGALSSARLIYLLGGFPQHLCQTLAGSLAWRAAISAYQGGAVLGGSSAGAMVLCQYYFDPQTGHLLAGLNLIPNACVIPHHNNFGKSWVERLTALLPDANLIGIDEQTGMIDDGQDIQWNVYGKGVVTIYRQGCSETHHPGEAFSV